MYNFEKVTPSPLFSPQILVLSFIPDRVGYDARTDFSFNLIHEKYVRCFAFLNLLTILISNLLESSAVVEKPSLISFYFS